MPRAKQIVAALLLSIGIGLTLLALVIFAAPFIATPAGTSEAGEAGRGAILFSLVLAVPACITTLAAIYLRGWSQARAGYVTLGLLFGVPLLTFLAAGIHE